MTVPTSTQTLPKKFGDYGGQFVPETLMPALTELENTYLQAKNDPEFQAELNHLLHFHIQEIADPDKLDEFGS